MYRHTLQFCSFSAAAFYSLTAGIEKRNNIIVLLGGQEKEHQSRGLRILARQCLNAGPFPKLLREESEAGQDLTADKI